MPRWLAGRSYLGLAATLFVVLLLVNLVLNPTRFSPASLGVTVGLASGLMLAAIASMPPILAGRGGIDISVGPLMGLVNVVVVRWLVEGLAIESPFVIVPMVLLLGLLSGILNGFLATVVRIQPIVATLGTSLLYAGITLTIAPSPIGTAPTWIKALAGPASIVPLVLVALAWLLIKRLPFYEQLMCVGSDDRAAYTAGIPVTTVRWLSYVLAGLFASVGGLCLTGLIGSADPNIANTYTLLAISAVALGGVSLAGGRGGLIAAVLGAADIFLLQTALTYFNVSTFVLQIVYGVVLTVAVALNADRLRQYLRRRSPA
ncbi:MAG TPA: ABC transporter permease [Geminicoccus sp.]|jgi:ribose transport system permease protein|uniref:ABC transporter permease n=1 Tax=Geminicoccus sp. TaxID=2024832 RepID=UPI002E369020|nr:ABC transporter permease [Geminicoccus sp.]HEX2526728.1 ABC transporter permease [Geminicoccus sp.]